jgi:hypothetical protein
MDSFFKKIQNHEYFCGCKNMISFNKYSIIIFSNIVIVQIYSKTFLEYIHNNITMNLIDSGSNMNLIISSHKK